MTEQQKKRTRELHAQKIKPADIAARLMLTEREILLQILTDAIDEINAEVDITAQKEKGE